MNLASADSLDRRAVSPAQEKPDLVLDLYIVVCILNLIGIQEILLILYQWIRLSLVLCFPSRIPAPALSILHLHDDSSYSPAAGI